MSWHLKEINPMIIVESVAGFAAAVFYAIVSRIMGERDEWSANNRELTWHLNHIVRAPCRDCEHDVYYDLDRRIWIHLHNEQVTSKTPHGQPHPAFPFPFTHQSIDDLDASLHKEGIA